MFLLTVFFLKCQCFDCAVTYCDVRIILIYIFGKRFELEVFSPKDQWSPHMDRIGLWHPSAHSPTSPPLHLLSGHFLHRRPSRRDSHCLGIFCNEANCQRVCCLFCTSNANEEWSKPALTSGIHYLFIWTLWFC